MGIVRRPDGCDCNWPAEECCDACAHISEEQEARILAAEAEAATFEARAAEFLAGLEALTRKTKIAVTSSAASGAWNQVEMVDAAEHFRGRYLRDDTDIEWVWGGDYTEPKATEA